MSQKKYLSLTFTLSIYCLLPLNYLKANKFWPPVARVDNVHGDRNLVCSCPSLDSYRDEEAA